MKKVEKPAKAKGKKTTAKKGEAKKEGKKLDTLTLVAGGIALAVLGVAVALLLL